MLRSSTRTRALALAVAANTDNHAHATAIGDIPEVAANANDGAHPADDGARAPENEVNISSTLAQLWIDAELILDWIVGKVVQIEASCDSIVGSLDPWLD